MKTLTLHELSLDDLPEDGLPIIYFDKQPSVEEFFDSLGHGHPSKVDINKFNKLVDVYEISWGNLSTVFDEGLGECVKCCPVTGEELRRVKAYTNDLVKKDLSEVRFIEEIEEMAKSNTHKTIITAHTTEMLASLHKAQSECLHKLINNLVQYNQGHVFIDDGDELNRFKKSVKVLEHMKIIKRIKNCVRSKHHYSYRIAPYLAYKGTQAMQESCCRYWFMEQAKERADEVFKRYDPVG